MAWTVLGVEVGDWETGAKLSLAFLLVTFLVLPQWRVFALLGMGWIYQLAYTRHCRTAAAATTPQQTVHAD